MESISLLDIKYKETLSPERFCWGWNFEYTQGSKLDSEFCNKLIVWSISFFSLLFPFVITIQIFLKCIFLVLFKTASLSLAFVWTLFMSTLFYVHALSLRLCNYAKLDKTTSLSSTFSDVLTSQCFIISCERRDYLNESVLQRASLRSNQPSHKVIDSNHKRKTILHTFYCKRDFECSHGSKPELFAWIDCSKCICHRRSPCFPTMTIVVLI